MFIAAWYPLLFHAYCSSQKSSFMHATGGWDAQHEELAWQSSQRFVLRKLQILHLKSIFIYLSILCIYTFGKFQSSKTDFLFFSLLVLTVSVIYLQNAIPELSVSISISIKARLIRMALRSEVSIYLSLHNHCRSPMSCADILLGYVGQSTDAATL